jgi:hypothetical protein
MMGYYNSFVLRVWSDGRGTTRGTIKHVGSRDSLAFADTERILAFVRAHLEKPDDPALASVDQPRDDETGPDDDGPGR